MKLWEATLRPFALKLAALDREIVDLAEKASAKKLRRMLAACKRVTAANCWWATFRIRDMVYSAVLKEMYKREMRD